MTGTGLASVAWRGLNGVFAVYKPPGMAAIQLKNIIEHNLLQEINSLEQQPLRNRVKIEKVENEDNTNALTVTSVPSLADHPLVTGPRYKKVSIAWLSPLDRMASGIMVMTATEGNKKIGMMNTAQFPSIYEVKGKFGMATDTFDESGKVWEKTTYHHIKSEKMNRVLAAMSRVHQSAMTRFSGVEMQSQAAYELAVRGMLRPAVDSPPLIIRMKCIHFDKPHFTIEMECLKEHGQFLRKTVHELGLEMKSSAVATSVRRTRQGPFTLDHALLQKHWKLEYILQAIQNCKKLVAKKKLLPYYASKKKMPEELIRMVNEEEAKSSRLKKRMRLLQEAVTPDSH
ncbi:pseudouridylate synthase TRUB2, mitochondrial-like [Saccoglossus kowalevskii]|uniref:Probable tRNA pseudouridine synthase 2-like n=1 Tax=Saccoglossus kowalevskii TaxID=10224 RepID=A0ABM0GKM0_SACKO|nr:PREDICTED: probable tRNA pseudouridine synthase 2-like [Saccoglossus kowalevskii]